MTAFDRFTQFHGRLSDLKVVWFPFLALKPDSPKTPITFKRLAIMIPCFAAWILPGLLVREWIVGNLSSFSWLDLARVYAYGLLGFTLWFNLVTAPLWNRRAKLISDGATQPAPAA